MLNSLGKQRGKSKIGLCGGGPRGGPAGGIPAPRREIRDFPTGRGIRDFPASGGAPGAEAGNPGFPCLEAGIREFPDLALWGPEVGGSEDPGDRRILREVSRIRDPGEVAGAGRRLEVLEFVISRGI